MCAILSVLALYLGFLVSLSIPIKTVSPNSLTLCISILAILLDIFGIVYSLGISLFGSQGIVVLCLSLCFYDLGRGVKKLHLNPHVGISLFDSILDQSHITASLHSYSTYPLPNPAVSGSDPSRFQRTQRLSLGEDPGDHLCRYHSYIL